jgi:uncharacterized membrane protein YhhN
VLSLGSSGFKYSVGEAGLVAVCTTTSLGLRFFRMVIHNRAAVVMAVIGIVMLIAIIVPVGSPSVGVG